MSVGCEVKGTYLPCLLSTVFAAAMIDSSLATSSWSSSTEPGC